jgi:hypothetical protein
MRKLCVWSRDRHALSPIFATVLLASAIIVFGSVAFYYSSNLTTTATNDYLSTLSNSQQAISERIGFENVVYDQSSKTLTVYIINCGSANNIKIDSVFLYDGSHKIAGGSPYSGSTQISALQPIDRSSPSPTPITGNALNVGKEAYFNVTLNQDTILSDPIYTIHLITQSGSYFDYEFAP